MKTISLLLPQTTILLRCLGDDVLGTAVQDLAMVLQVGSLTSDIPLESKAGGKRLTSKLKVKTVFTPASPELDIKWMHVKTGRIQIYVQEAKNLKNVESFLGGDQDPYACFRLLHQADDKCNKSTPKFTQTRYINGGGKNVVYADWIELQWTKEMRDELKALMPSKEEEEDEEEESDGPSIKNVISVLSQSKFTLQTAMWDNNYPLSDKVIGSCLTDLTTLLSSPSGLTLTLTETELGLPVEKRKVMAEGEVAKPPVSTGQLKVACQFVPDPEVPEIKEYKGVEKGVIKLHVIACAGGRLSDSSKNTKKQKVYETLTVQGSIRRTQDDKTIDKKNPSVSTESVDVNNEKETLVPCIFNQIITIPWNAEGKPSNVATPQLHLDVMTGKTSCGKITLPLATITSHVTAMSGPSWLPLVESNSSTYGFGDGVRLNLSWQFFPEIEREDVDHTGMRSTFDALINQPLDFKPPIILPGKLYVKVLEAKNLPANQLFGTSDPFPEAKLLPGDEKARMHACEDGGKTPHWDWTSTPPWSFLVEDASVSSLEVSIYNEKAGIEKALLGAGSDKGSMMGTCHISLPQDILNRKNPNEPSQKWMLLSQPKTNMKSKTKKNKDNSKMPMVLVETWFEKDGANLKNKSQKPAVGWSPSLGSDRPLPFFPKPTELDVPGTLWIQPLEAYDLRNMETVGFTQDPFVKVTFLCGNDKKPVCVMDSEVAYDKGKKASWKTSKPMSIPYTAEMGRMATQAGSTPYLKMEVWDKNTIMSNRLVGKVEIPILALLQNPSSIYARTMTMMDEDQIGVRGKLDCKLQFLPTPTDDAVVSDDVPFSDIHSYAREAQGGDLTLSIVKAKDLVRTQMMGAPDPFVRVRLSRGGFAASTFEGTLAETNDIKSNDAIGGEDSDIVIQPREAVSLSQGGSTDKGGASSYTTRAVEDGASDPVWDEPPFTLTTWDAAFDMLRVEIVNEENQAIIGNFELPLIEVLALQDEENVADNNTVIVEHAPDPNDAEEENNINDSNTENDTDNDTENNNAVTMSTGPTPIDVAEGWYPVFKCDLQQAEKRGEIRLQMRYENKQVLDSAAEQIVHYGPVRYLGGSGFVHMTIVGARNMRQGSKDLYVGVALYPEDAPGPSHPSEHGWKRKTDVDERSGKNEDPIWNQSFVVPILWKPGDEKPPVLNFELKKQGGLMGGGTIGSVVLDIAPFVLFPNQPASMYLPLGKDGRDGELLVNVQFVHVEENSSKRSSMKTPSPPFLRNVMSSISTCSHRGNLDLTINRARNLAVVEWQIMGKQDPFVRVKIHGGALGAKGVMTETRSKKNGGTNAVWMEQLQVSFDDTILPPSTSTTPLMEFIVLDQNDHTSATKIGSVLVPMFPFQMNDGHTGENWFPIRSGTGKNTKLAGELHVASQWLNEGMLAGASGPKLSGDRPLYVHVIGARGLPQVKSIEKQDPFVTIEILGQDVTVSTSPANDQAHAPSWNAYFPIPMSDNEFSGESPTILLEVKDKGTMSNTFIAKCEFQLPDDVLSPPYKKIELKHFPLVDKKGNSTTGTIWIEIAREPFEGMEGRDDGLSRGEGQTTLLEDLGEDEDDDGLADGRLHVELIGGEY